MSRKTGARVQDISRAPVLCAHLDRTATVAAAILFAASFVHPGDEMFQTGCGQLLSCLWLLLVVGWLGGRLWLRKRFLEVSPSSLRFTVADVLLTCFLGWLLVLSPLAQRETDGFATANLMVVWCAAAAAWFLFRQLFRDRETMVGMLLLVVTLGVWESLDAVIQEVFEYPAMLAAYQDDPESMLRIQGIDTAPESPGRLLFESRLRSAKPTGSYLLTNTLGGQLAFVLAFSLGSLLLAPPLTGMTVGVTKEKIVTLFKTMTRPMIVRVILATVALLFLLGALWLTQCRSAIVALIVGLAALECHRRDLLRLRRGQRPFLRMAFAGGLCVLLLFGGLSAAMRSGQGGHGLVDGATRSLGYRLVYWQTSLHMIAARPVFGCGLGNFPQHYLHYKPATASEEILDPHNAFIELAACGGLPACLLFMAFSAVILYPVLRPSWEEEAETAPPESPPLVTGRFLSTIGLAGLLLHPLVIQHPGPSLFVLLLFVPVLAALLWFWGGRFFPWRPALLVTALGVLLLHLMAAGGIGYLNILVTLLLPAALLVHAVPKQRIIDVRGEYVIGSAAIVVSAACYLLLFLPQNDAARWKDAAETARTNAERVRLWERATERLVFVPSSDRLELMRARLAFWEEQPADTDRLESLLSEIDATLHAAGEKPGVLMQAIGVLERVEAMTGSGEYRERIVTLAREAVRRYPNTARTHAFLALACARYGMREEMTREKTTALTLDDTMPHRDQKLPGAIREALERLP